MKQQRELSLIHIFAEKVKNSRIVIAADNFGCGSSREHAPLAIKASGVKLIIARSYARIFFRNAINIGLPVIVNEQAADDISEGDTVEADLNKGEIRNLSTGKIYLTKPFPEFIQTLISRGGYVNYVKDKFDKES